MPEKREVQIYGVTTDGAEVRIRVDNNGYFKSSPAKTSVHNAVAADVLSAVNAHANLRLVGFAARESASTAAVATFRLVNSSSVQGNDIVLPVELNANESTSEWQGDGVECPNGITVDRIAGTFDLILYYKID